MTFFSFCFRKKKIHVFQNRFLYGIIIKRESWECMNFLILSPLFPATNWNFCDRLKLNGINTLGIGYEPYEELRIEVRHALQDYIQIQQYQSYDAALRAAAFFTYRYGWINGMESFQEGRLFFDARLRTDFHVESGCTVSNVQRFLDSGTRRAWIRACGVQSLRQDGRYLFRRHRSCYLHRSMAHCITYRRNSCMHTRMARSLRMHGMDVNSCGCQSWREVFIYGRLCWIIQVLHAQQPQGVFPGENSIGFRKRRKKS